MNLWKHADKWGAPPIADAVTLGEGGTPLVRSRVIGPALGLKNLWFKVEGCNPTGSYKDRFAAAAVTHLKRDGRVACLGTSSGNTGAAPAAATRGVHRIPTTAREVYDVVGAGDTVTAYLATMLAAGATPLESAIISNFAAGVGVRKSGAATVSAAEVLAAYDQHLAEH